MITPDDLSGDPARARRVLVLARSIAPCLDSLEGEAQADAIAILDGVIAELPEPGQSRTKSLSRNGTSLSFADDVSVFSADARASLRSLCGLAGPGGHPAGSFPSESPTARMWPEGPYREAGAR